MNIATLFPEGWTHFLAGGLIMGTGMSLLFVMTGIIGGMSSVFTTTLSYVTRAPHFRQQKFLNARNWRLVLAAGLIAGAFAWRIWAARADAIVTTVPWWRLLVGGVCVGYGARRAGGCTSGHGICGLASLQLPSLIAVLIFLATAMVTAQVAARMLAR